MARFFIYNLVFINALLFFFLPPLAGDQKNEPVRIGVTLSLEGKYKEPSAMILNGYQLWVEQINKKGGLLGRPVQLILYDDQSREDLVADYYEKMITQDEVDLVLSPYGTPLTMTASEVTEKYDRLIAGGITLQRRWGQPDDIGTAVASLVRGDLPYATGQILTIDGGLTALTL